MNLVRPEVRGIHTSRLYLHVDRALEAEPLSPSSVHAVLRDFLQSHADLSDRALLHAAFPLMLRRPAPRSQHSGWRSYAVTIPRVLERGEFVTEVGVEVTGETGKTSGNESSDAMGSVSLDICHINSGRILLTMASAVLL